MCGDSAMAEDVADTIHLVLQKAGRMNEQESQAFIALLRVFII